MTQEVFGGGSSRSYISAKKIREMKKKALQSYKKIPTIKQKSDKEHQATSKIAESDLDNFIQKL